MRSYYVKRALYLAVAVGGPLTFLVALYFMANGLAPS